MTIWSMGSQSGTYGWSIFSPIGIYVTCVPKHGMPCLRLGSQETDSEADDYVLPAGK